jgi:pyruvate/2-oxoglutarate dehydrogenase complex dihydrolipoamide acyltransferase (E2) component
MSRNKTVDTPTASQFHGSDVASGERGRVRRTKHADYQLVPFPKTQRVIALGLRLSEHKHIIHMLTEVDVTTPRHVIQEQKARGIESLSFTAFIAACLGKAVDEDKSVQAHRKGRNQLMLFQDVDIYIMVEREVEGQKFPLPYVVRAANHKTAREIHQEIRAFQKLHTAEVPSMPPWLARGFARWPGVMMRLFGWVVGRSPLLWKRSVGTCGITAVGMVGKGIGWAIPSAPIQSLFLTLGGITEKLGVVDGQVAIREYLCLTVSLDHDIIDGAPAARFVTRLQELIEGGFGLLDQEVMAEQPSM